MSTNNKCWRECGEKRNSYTVSRNINWCSHYGKQYSGMGAQSLSRVRLFETPWTVDCQLPPSMGFPRQEYWSGLPFPPPEDLLHTGIGPKSPTLAGVFFTTESPGKPWRTVWRFLKKIKIDYHMILQCHSWTYIQRQL